LYKPNIEPVQDFLPLPKQCIYINDDLRKSILDIIEKKGKGQT